MRWFETTGKDGDTAKLPSVPPVKNMFVCSATYRDRSGLYLVDRDGEVVKTLVVPAPSTRLRQFDVTPDSRWVLYTADVQREGASDPYPTICAVPIVGGESAEIVRWDPEHETCYQNPVVSPTGQHFVCEFGLRQIHNPDLQILELEDFGDRLYGSWNTSISNSLRIGNHAARFMADGKRVVYFSNFAYEDLLEVCLYDPELAEEDLMGAIGWRLTENADGVWNRPRAIAVQPEWEQIFFVQGHTRDAERLCVFLLPDLSPGATRNTFDTITREYRRIGGLDVSGDGQLLCYDADGTIYCVGADGSGSRAISPSGKRCESAVFSRDSAMLACLSDGHLCIGDSNGGAFEVLGNANLRIQAFAWTA